MTGPHNIDVYYDGECPICRWEVRLYTRADRAGRILWTDIGALTDAALPPGKTREELLGKFHVRNIQKDDAAEWFIGVDAFARIWRVLPRFRHFAFIFSVPGLRQIFMVGYLAFLRWQRWHRKHRCTPEPPAG